jgi:hypothetical protein
MIEEVSRQLFRQFSACVKQRLEVEVADESQLSGQTPAESLSTDKSPEAETEALSAAPLVLRAMWTVLRRFFLRLVGKQPG